MNSSLQSKFSTKKGDLRRRRNFVRRVLLVLFTSVFIYLCYLTVYFSSNNNLIINVKNSTVANELLLTSQIHEIVSNKNFFSISPKSVASGVLSENTLLKDVVVRKYLFPKPIVFVYLIERKIWANLEKTGSSSKKEYFISDDGELVDKKFTVNKSPKLRDLVKVYLLSKFDLKKDKLLLLRDFISSIRNEGFNVREIYVDKGHNLRVILKNGISVKFGMLSEGCINKIYKLKEAFAVAESNMYHIKALDLTLEKSAVLKVNEKSSTDTYLEKVIHAQKKDFFGRVDKAN